MRNGRIGTAQTGAAETRLLADELLSKLLNNSANEVVLRVGATALEAELSSRGLVCIRQSCPHASYNGLTGPKVRLG